LQLSSAIYLKAGRVHLDKAKHLIEERCGIPPSNVLISCTHTHTGPPAEDIPLFAQKVADSVQLANNRLSEAELGCEREVESKPLANRRFLMKDGTIRTNPRPGDPNIVKPLGTRRSGNQRSSRDGCKRKNNFSVNKLRYALCWFKSN